MIENKREIPQKIKVGDIIKNLHASETNPIRKSIIVAKNSEYAKFCYPNSKGIFWGRYYLRDLMYDPAFNVVGHVDLREILTELFKTKEVINE